MTDEQEAMKKLLQEHFSKLGKEWLRELGRHARHGEGPGPAIERLYHEVEEELSRK